MFLYKKFPVTMTTNVLTCVTLVTCMAAILASFMICSQRVVFTLELPMTTHPAILLMTHPASYVNYLANNLVSK